MSAKAGTQGTKPKKPKYLRGEKVDVSGMGTCVFIEKVSGGMIAVIKPNGMLGYTNSTSIKGYAQ